MIFVFIEDGTLEIVEDLAEARRNYEGLDVESGVYDFFDEAGFRLAAQFLQPNRRGKFLGLIPWVEHGVFELVPEPTETESIDHCLLETSALSPNRWFTDLAEVKDYLRKHGVHVSDQRE